MLFNGRVYDPQTGRFLSADPIVQSQNDLQSYNRYSYALNNPLVYTDPTGYIVWRPEERAIPDGASDDEIAEINKWNKFASGYNKALDDLAKSKGGERL
jgi:uncharacterized protein RhaS with RHS repeats